MEVNQVIQDLERRNPGEVEYLQAVREVLESIAEVYNRNPQFEKAGIIERLVEPDRVLTFKVPWIDDEVGVRSCPHIRNASILPAAATAAAPMMPLKAQTWCSARTAAKCAFRTMYARNAVTTAIAK